jgi:hypothetical protein
MAGGVSNGWWDYYPVQPAGSLEAQGIEPWQAGSSCLVSCYDIPAGVIVTKGWGSPYDECGTGVVTRDTYQVGGVEPGGILSFAAELWVTGTIRSPAEFYAGLCERHAGGSCVDGWAEDTTFDFHLRLSLQHAAGDTFTVECDLYGMGHQMNGEARGTGVLHFSGLPVGAYVTSCQGYDLPVPTRSTSWGRVKATYR